MWSAVHVTKIKTIKNIKMIVHKMDIRDFL
jgi:hypothetical protein